MCNEDKMPVIKNEEFEITVKGIFQKKFEMLICKKYVQMQIMKFILM